MRENGKRIGAVISEADELHHLVEEAAWISVRREAHDLVFVGVNVKPKVMGKDPIKRAERMEGWDLGEDFYFVPAACGDGHALDFAHAVADEDQRVIEPAEMKGARGVGEMVRNGNEFLVPFQIPEMLGQKSFLNFWREDFVILAT